MTVYIKSYNYLSNITLKTLLLFISHNEGNKDSQNDLCSHAVLYLYSHLDIRPEFLQKNDGYLKLKIKPHFKQSVLGPVPQKMVKFNPGLSQISSTVFSSKNMQLEITRYCLVFTMSIVVSNDITKWYPKQCIGM